MGDIQCCLWLNHLKAVDITTPYLPTNSVLRGGIEAGVLGERYQKTHSTVLSTFLSALAFFQSWCQGNHDHRLLCS